MTDKMEDIPMNIRELEEKHNNEYSDMMDSNTADIKYLINDIIDRTGIINYLEITLPKSCLKDVLKALDSKMEDGLKFQMNVYSKTIMLRFFNK